MNLETRQERVLYTAPKDENTWPFGVQASPDGKQVGFYSEGWFRIVELESGEVAKRIQCSIGYDFDWSDSGICYLERAADEDNSKTQLIVFDPRFDASTTIATGEFTCPVWVSTHAILVCRASNGLWLYDWKSKKSKQVFPFPGPTGDGGRAKSPLGGSDPTPSME